MLEEQSIRLEEIFSSLISRNITLNEQLVAESFKEQLREKIRMPFTVAQAITQCPTPFYLTGGVVRDLLLGRTNQINDFDFIGDFDLEQIARDYPDLVVGRWDELNVIKLAIDGNDFDFVATPNIKSRLAQHDLTSSILCLGNDGEVIDFFDGVQSLQNKEIKIIDPYPKLMADPRRILRVFRFAAELGFTIETTTLKAVTATRHLLQTVSLAGELKKITSLPPEVKSEVLDNLCLFGIDRYLPDELFDSRRQVDVQQVENFLSNQPVIRTVKTMFGATTYLVGGAVRDTVFQKIANDFDFKIELPLETMVGILEAFGYEQTNTYEVDDNQFFVNTTFGAIGTKITGVDVHLSSMITADIPSLVMNGDISLNCGVFNVGRSAIENPRVVSMIGERVIRFCNPEEARLDPLIILNALKQLSRLPDAVVPPQTQQIITESMPPIITFLLENPAFSYKLKYVCGNLNSEKVYALFSQFPGGKELLEAFPQKKKRLKVNDPQFVSLPIDELSPTDRSEIEQLIETSYGKVFNPDKLFTEKISSVVFKRVDGKIVSCCLIDGERAYTVAAQSGELWTGIMAELVQANSTLWGTVTIARKSLIAKCVQAGMKVETNPQVIRTILANKCGKQPDEIDVFELDGMVVFCKKSEPDYVQVLVRS